MWYKCIYIYIGIYVQKTAGAEYSINIHPSLLIRHASAPLSLERAHSDFVLVCAVLHTQQHVISRESMNVALCLHVCECVCVCLGVRHVCCIELKLTNSYPFECNRSSIFDFILISSAEFLGKPVTPAAAHYRLMRAYRTHVQRTLYIHV